MDIVLCATQRCGSTLIVEDMRNSGVLGQPKEWLVPWEPSKTGIDWRTSLAAVERRATGENGVSAIKVMAKQLAPVDRCLATFLSSEATGEFPHVATAFQDARWVWLRRRDVVLQAISRVMAWQTKINHATARSEDTHFAGNLARGYDPRYNEKTVYRYDQILQQITAITLENLVWQRFFESHGIVPHEMVYEDVIADEAMGHLDTLGALAGLEAAPPRRPRTMVKVGNARNAEWRERFLQDSARNGLA